MSTATAAAPSTKVITGKVRFSYVKVWEAEAFEEGDEKKYSISLLIDKNDKATLNAINNVVNILVEQAKAKNGGKLPLKFKLPLRDGDEERGDDPAYKGCMFLNATSKTKPGIVDKNVMPILNHDEFYSGCYGRASINAFSFEGKQKGISFGLNNVQKLEDGEPLSGRASAAEDFGGEFGSDQGNVDDIL
jgi:ssDNA-binding protein